MSTNTPPHEYERFWTALKRESSRLADEPAGVVVETGQPFNGALSVAYRVTKPGHGFPLAKVTVKAGPGARRDILTVENLEWMADDPKLLVKREQQIEMRCDQSVGRFFLQVKDGQEIDEADAPKYFLGRARAIFAELLNKRGEARHL
jgi:hypothetical protein